MLAESSSDDSRPAERTVTYWSAVIAAAVAVVAAVATQMVIWRREQQSRTYDRRRTALTDAQNAALALRNRLADYGPQARRAAGTQLSGLGRAQRRLDDAFALFEVTLTRLEDAVVVDAAHAWLDKARFHSISVIEVPTEVELELWRGFNNAVGAALISASGLAEVPTARAARLAAKRGVAATNSDVDAARSDVDDADGR